MKIFIALILSLSLFGGDFQVQEDKQKHFYGSALIGAITTAIAVDQKATKTEAFFYGVAASLLVGIAKEAYDQHSYGGADIEDLGADALGAIAGSALSIQFEWDF